MTSQRIKSLSSISLLLIMTVFTQSCVSNKGFQTARSMDKGKFGFGAGLGLPRAEYRDIDKTNLLFQDTTNLGGFTFEGFFKYGITERLDVGLNLTFIGTSGFDVKYQFLGDHDSKIAGSASLGISMLRATYSDTNGNSESGIFDFNVPTYFSYHPIENFAFYLSPRYTHRRYLGSTDNFLGGLVGIRVGREGAFFIEYGYLNPIKNERFGSQSQLNLGAAYNIN